MKKYITVLCILLLFIITNKTFSNETDTPTDVNVQFPLLKFKDQFNQTTPVKYYRFPTDTWFYEPLDLSYFPHERWEKPDWALLSRRKDGKTYNQTIYLDSPAETTLIHGTEIGRSYGFFSDFYLYADLFIVDNYPNESGSCYLYYSNSLLKGFDESKGILIDPKTGIYEATNSYGGNVFKTYNPNTIHHNLELIQKLDANLYNFDENNIENTTIGSKAYPQVAFDDQFNQDYTSITSSYRNPNAQPVQVYRIEIIRVDRQSEIFINGKKAASFKDPIRTNYEPDKVSFSYGPILKEGGIVVTCSIGDFYIFMK